MTSSSMFAVFPSNTVPSTPPLKLASSPLVPFTFTTFCDEPCSIFGVLDGDVMRRGASVLSSVVMRAMVAMTLCAACGTPAGRGPKPASVDNHAAVTAGVPPLSGGGDRAYVADGSGLVEVAASGASQVLADQGVRWCSADARARVVWFVTDHGLSAFDLDDRTIHPVIVRDLAVHDPEGARIGDLAVIIDWGKEKLGGENILGFDVGVSIAMTDHPQLALTMGCWGDRRVYCYDDKGEPSPSVVALQAHVKDLGLVEPAYVALLAKRGEGRSLWSPKPPAPSPPAPPALDRTRCHEIPEQCGELTAVPGQPVWLVVTDNSRGDYFDQTRELWDPVTGEFVRVADHRIVRSRQVPSENAPSTNYGGLRVSPAGLSFDATVFDTTHVIYAPKEEGGVACGWASGGWRIPGPTG